MSCRFHEKAPSAKFNFIGGGSKTPVLDICLLKEENGQIYRELLRLGLQSSMYTDDCPVASGNKWSLCPFREEP